MVGFMYVYRSLNQTDCSNDLWKDGSSTLPKEMQAKETAGRMEGPSAHSQSLAFSFPYPSVNGYAVVNGEEVALETLAGKAAPVCWREGDGAVEYFSSERTPRVLWGLKVEVLLCHVGRVLILENELAKIPFSIRVNTHVIGKHPKNLYAEEFSLSVSLQGGLISIF